MVGQYFRGNRARNGSSDDGDKVLSVIWIDEGSLSGGASIGRQAGPSLFNSMPHKSPRVKRGFRSLQANLLLRPGQLRIAITPEPIGCEGQRNRVRAVGQEKREGSCVVVQQRVVVREDLIPIH